MKGRAVKIDPRFTSAFSENDAARMRKAYLIAAERFCTAHTLDNTSKCNLASIILYICTDEKRHHLSRKLDHEALATEALEVLLNRIGNERTH